MRKNTTIAKKIRTSNPRRPTRAELSKGQKNWWPVAFEDDRDPTTAELRSQLQADVAWSAWLEMQDANRVAHALFDLCKDKMGNRFPFRWRNLTNTGGILCCGTVEILAEQMIWELENLELFGVSPDGHVERKATITVQVIDAMGNIPRIKAEPDPDAKIDWTLYATVDDVPLRVVPEVSESVNDDHNEYVKLMAMVPRWPGTVLEFLMATCRASMAGLIRSLKQWREQTELHDYWEASGMTTTIKTLWQMIEALRDERNEERRPSMAMAAANFADGSLAAEQLVDARRNPDASPPVPFTKTAFEVLDRWHKSVQVGARSYLSMKRRFCHQVVGLLPCMLAPAKSHTFAALCGETCRICQENYFEIIPAYLAQPGSVGRREVVYYCKNCADLADDLDPLIAGVQQDVVTLARLPDLPPMSKRD